MRKKITEKDQNILYIGIQISAKIRQACCDKTELWGKLLSFLTTAN